MTDFYEMIYQVENENELKDYLKDFGIDVSDVDNEKLYNLLSELGIAVYDFWDDFIDDMWDEFETMFSDRRFYNDYVNYAKEIVKQIGGDWRRKWYKTWKVIRDLDWSQSMPIGNLQNDKQIPLSA